MSSNLKELFLLQPDLVFLNHGSFGACPKPVFKAYQDWQLTLERQPVAFLDQSRDLLERMKNVRKSLAGELGASPNDIVSVENATAGLNIVARSIDLQPGDEILTSDHEYNALNNTWRFNADRAGAKIVVAKIPLPLTSQSQFFETFVNAMTDRTKVLFLSHITSPTALLFPIKKIVKEARKRGIVTIIDGAHAPGLIPLNLDALDADYYAGNCHKWMMAPKGSAFLWARRDRQSQLEPLVVSHGWTPRTEETDQQGPFGNSRFVDAFDVQGTRDPSAWLSVPDAIAFKHAHDWGQVAQDSAELAHDTAAKIVELTGRPLLASDPFLAPQMIATPLPEVDIGAFKTQLLEEFNIEVPVFRWDDICILRFSIQGYNTPADAARLVEAVAAVLKRGQIG